MAVGGKRLILLSDGVAAGPDEFIVNFKEHRIGEKSLIYQPQIGAAVIIVARLHRCKNLLVRDPGPLVLNRPPQWVSLIFQKKF